jgi:hypothetical protein
VSRTGANRASAKNSVVNNLTEFFARFRDLNVRSNPELDILVEQAQSLVRGVTPQRLRDSDALRQHVTELHEPAHADLDGHVVTAPDTEQ